MTDINTEHYWMPFTPNRAFKKNPKMYTKAQGMYMTLADGREILDATAGLWCTNAGHGRVEIAEAVHKQLLEMDYANPFNFGHEKAFQLATRLVEEVAPAGLNRVFFTNSGSESVDTALKIARAYWRQCGEGQKTRFISRQKGYHGVNMGGVSVAGLTPNRKAFGQALETSHLSHTCLPENAFSKGLGEFGTDKLVAELEAQIAMYDASNIAAVIIEPMAGAGGVIIPPQGYLEKVREICTANNILLIFDEVITAYGRLGSGTAAGLTGVTPDLITTAKGLTNGAIPMGAVFASQEVYDAFMQGPETAPEFFHGYTYSAHPVACAAALATLDIYKKEALFDRCTQISPAWEAAIHQFDHHENLTDIRNWGLVGAIDFVSGPAKNGIAGLSRAQSVASKAMEKGITMRASGDTIMMSPPLIIEQTHIDAIFKALGEAIAEVG